MIKSSDQINEEPPTPEENFCEQIISYPTVNSQNKESFSKLNFEHWQNVLFEEISNIEKKRMDILIQVPINTIGNSYIFYDLKNNGSSVLKKGSVIEPKIKLNSIKPKLKVSNTIYSEYNYPFILDIFKDYLFNFSEQNQFLHNKRYEEINLRRTDGKLIKQIGIRGVDIMSMN